MKKILVLLSILFSSFAYAGDSEWKEKGWEKLEEKDGISSYRKLTEGSPLKGVGGEALIDAPLSKVLWVLLDNEHKNEWIDKYKEAFTVKEISPFFHVLYAAFDMPFPVTDREFVYSYEFIPSPELKGVIVNVKSANEYAPMVKKGQIRGDIVEGRYILIPQGDKTYIKAEYLADPKGALPSWIVNVVQKSWPYKTIKGLREQVKKDFVKEWPYTKELEEKFK